MLKIDLYKGHEVIDQELLWQVLARCGVPPAMITVIRQFHDGIKFCELSEDGMCSEAFDVEQGSRQVYVLSPLPFNIFFATVLAVILQHFSTDEEVLASLVHLEESRGAMGPG